MRGADSDSENLFGTIRLEDFVPASHPQRPIRIWMNDTLGKMEEKSSAMCEADIRGGRPSTCKRPRRFRDCHGNDVVPRKT